MSDKKYCTYLTIYSGDKMPEFYIGSTSIANLETGYRGSVRSKRYKEIWESELANNPQLFDTIILYEFATREEALKNEHDLQKKVKAPKNPRFINMGYAAGVFGKSMSGESNPFYGKKHSEEARLKMRTDRKDTSGKNNHFYGKKHDQETVNRIIRNNRFAVATTINGVEYLSLRQAEVALGISKYFIKKMIKEHGSTTFETSV